MNNKINAIGKNKFVILLTKTIGINKKSNNKITSFNPVVD